MKILAIIPARGGSKGVPKKNIKMMHGKPLIAYSIEQALSVKHLFHRVIVSTEDKEIARISMQYGAEIPFLRPQELAEDHAPSLGLVQHAVHFIEKQDKIKLDWVCLLQPTNPLRTPIDIKDSIHLCSNTPCDSVISVAQAEHQHPVYMKKIIDGYLVPFGPKETEGTRRQDLTPQAYFRDGSIYLTKRDVVIDHNSLWGTHALPLIMPSIRSVGIDNALDWEIVSTLMASK
jgi:CMP-N,N'-diacetyllegionaminic acid synthase